MLIWRQERRSLSWSAMLSIGGVAAGTAVLVLSMSILNGFSYSVSFIKIIIAIHAP